MGTGVSKNSKSRKNDEWESSRKGQAENTLETVRRYETTDDDICEITTLNNDGINDDDYDVTSGQINDDGIRSPVAEFEKDLCGIQDTWHSSRHRGVHVKASLGTELQGYWEIVAIQYMKYCTENGSWKPLNNLPVTTKMAKQVANLQNRCSEQIKVLQNADSFISEDSFEALYKLCRVSDTGVEDLGGILIACNYQDVFENVWHSLHKTITMDLCLDHNDTKEYLSLSLLKEATIAFSKFNQRICSEMGSTMIPILPAEFSLQVNKSSVLNLGGTKLLWNSYRESLKRTMILLYYHLRNSPQHRSFLRQLDFVEILQPYLRSRFMLIRARALFVLVSIVNEDESDRLNIGNMNVEFLVRILRKTMDEKDHVSRHYSFSSCEVVDGISALAVDDDNKRKFIEVSSETLSLLQQLLENGLDFDEMYSAAKAVWVLSFHPENHSAIRDHPKMTTTLADIVSRNPGENGDLAKACDGVMWELYGMTYKMQQEQAGSKQPSVAIKDITNKPIDKDDSAVKHVMISYQWDVQPSMIRVKDQLKQLGYTVWMDVECISGSTLEAMAEAVENSAVVLICLSEKYKWSPSCRAEAEYTYKLRKPFIPLRLQDGYDADGWLGIMMGTKLWIDLSSTAKVSSNIGALQREIGGRGKSSAVETTEDTLPSEINNQTLTLAKQRSSLTRTNSHSLRQTTCAKEASLWDQDDVMNWLDKSGLTSYRNTFIGYDGERLLGLKSISTQAPDFFYNALKSDMKFKTLLDIVKFKQALDAIL